MRDASLCLCCRNIQYIERDGAEHFHTLSKFSDSLHKKITLLKYFRSYMNEHLLKAGADVTPREGDEMTRLPFLKTWFRTRNAMVLHLSNGTLQVSEHLAMFMGQKAKSFDLLQRNSTTDRMVGVWQDTTIFDSFACV